MDLNSTNTQGDHMKRIFCLITLINSALLSINAQAESKSVNSLTMAEWIIVSEGQTFTTIYSEFTLSNIINEFIDAYLDLESMRW